MLIWVVSWKCITICLVEKTSLHLTSQWIVPILGNNISTSDTNNSTWTDKFISTDQKNVKDNLNSQPLPNLEKIAGYGRLEEGYGRLDAADKRKNGYNYRPVEESKQFFLTSSQTQTSPSSRRRHSLTWTSWTSRSSSSLTSSRISRSLDTSLSHEEYSSLSSSTSQSTTSCASVGKFTLKFGVSNNFW